MPFCCGQCGGGGLLAQAIAVDQLRIGPTGERLRAAPSSLAVRSPVAPARTQSTSASTSVRLEVTKRLQVPFWSGGKITLCSWISFEG